MDEHREEREELAAVDREATDTLLEQEAAEQFWFDGQANRGVGLYGTETNRATRA